MEKEFNDGDGFYRATIKQTVPLTWWRCLWLIIMWWVIISVAVACAFGLVLTIHKAMKTKKPVWEDRACVVEPQNPGMCKLTDGKGMIRSTQTPGRR